MSKSFLSLVTLGVIFIMPVIVSAQFSLYDGFQTPGQYTAGTDITTQTGAGSGAWDGNWFYGGLVGSPFNTETTSLSYSQGGNNLVTTNGSLDKTQTGGGNTTIHRPIDNAAIGGASEIWFSFLFQTNDAQRFWFSLADATNNTPRGPAVTLNAGVLEVQVNNFISSTTFDITAGETYFLIGRITTDIAENDTTIEAWLDPELTGSLMGTSISATNPNYSVLNSNFVSLRANTNNTVIFDEIRFGTTLDSVRPIPEPSVYALGAGLVALLGRMAWTRRRHPSRV